MTTNAICFNPIELTCTFISCSAVPQKLFQSPEIAHLALCLLPAVENGRFAGTFQKQKDLGRWSQDPTKGVVTSTLGDIREGSVPELHVYGRHTLQVVECSREVK